MVVMAHPHAKPVTNHEHQWHRGSEWKRNTELINTKLQRHPELSPSGLEAQSMHVT